MKVPVLSRHYPHLLPESDYVPTKDQPRNSAVGMPRKGQKDRRDTALQTKDHAY